MAWRNSGQAQEDGGGATYVPPPASGGSGRSRQDAHGGQRQAPPPEGSGGSGSPAGWAGRADWHAEPRRWDLERVSDRIALAVGSTPSFYVHLAFYGGLFALRLVGVLLPTILLLVATLVSLEGVFLVIFVQRSANQQAARLEEAIVVIRHNTADHLSEPLDVVVKDIRRELAVTSARVVELARALHPEGASAGAAVLAEAPSGLVDGAPTLPVGAVDVMVVDDDVSVCELVRDVLSEQGYSVLTATSGEDAVALLGSYQPRLVLADLDMPAMSGWALNAWLKAHDRLHTVPVILISASLHLAREARLLGAQGYVAKPFDIDHLLRVVGSHLLAA